MENSLMYKPREKTDVLFCMPDGNFHFRGSVDRIIRYVEDNYLCRDEPWTDFVKVYREHKQTVGWDGEFWGKMMRGAVLTYQYTHSEKLYNALTKTVLDMLDAQMPTGEFSTYEEDKMFGGWDVWCRKYILLGFEYYLEICKDAALADRITTAVCRHADRIIERVGDPKYGKIAITKACSSWQGLPASSILEPMVRLYNLTGEKRYLSFAAYIVDNGGVEDGNIWEEAYRNEKYPYQYRTRKAYEMMSCFEGLLEYYRVTSMEKYKTAAVRYAKRIMESDITIIGCAGCEHELFDNSAKTQLDTEYGGIMQETCVTVTWMKFCFQLLLLTGDASFADQIETSAYNAMPGAVNEYGITDAIEGMPFDSYSPLLFSTRARLSGGFRELEHVNYGCCGCIGAAGTALMALSAAMRSRDGLYLNMYYPGEIRAEAPSGNVVTLKVDTRYPADGAVRITFSSETDETMRIAVRIPAYSKNSTVSINGIRTERVGSGYYSMERTWKNGDVIELIFDTRVRVCRKEGPDENAKHHVALLKGPVVLARDARLGEKIDDIVDVDEDENGYAVSEPSQTATFPVNMEYRILNKDGSHFTVIDYASAGKTYDRGSVMTAWMATQNYWEVDFTKPILLADRVTEGKRFLMIGEDEFVKACFSTDEAAVWKIAAAEDGYVRIETAKNRYLTVTDDDPGAHASVQPYSETDCQKWKIVPFVRNYFILIHKKTGCTLYEDYDTLRYRLFATEKGSDKRYPAAFRNNNTKVNVLFYVKNVTPVS